MVVFDAIDKVALFLNIFVSIYLLAIFLYIILSWIRVPYWMGSVRRFLYDVCEPYLALWRRLLPIRFGALDFTPMIAILALILAERVVVAVLQRLH
jgi:YggT family protein